MLVFVDANLVLFAVPKTGSTAYHLALRGKADISLINKPFLKHMSMRKYEADFAPFLQKAYGLAPARVAVMRDPLEQLRSWYRYRQKPKSRAKAGQHAALGLSFDEFVQETLKERPQPMARVGSQYDFCAARMAHWRWATFLPIKNLWLYAIFYNHSWAVPWQPSSIMSRRPQIPGSASRPRRSCAKPALQILPCTHR